MLVVISYYYEKFSYPNSIVAQLSLYNSYHGGFTMYEFLILIWYNRWENRSLRKPWSREIREAIYFSFVSDSFTFSEDRWTEFPGRLRGRLNSESSWIAVKSSIVAFKVYSVRPVRGGTRDRLKE